MWMLAAAAGLVVVALWIGLAVRRSRQSARLLAEAADAMVEQLRGGEPTTVVQLLRDLTDCLVRRAEAANRVAVVVRAAFPSASLRAEEPPAERLREVIDATVLPATAVAEALAELAAAAEPAALVRAFVAGQVDPIEHDAMVHKLRAAANAVTDWQGADDTDSRAASSAADAVAAGAAALLDGLTTGVAAPNAASVPAGTAQATGADSARYAELLSGLRPLDRLAVAAADALAEERRRYEAAIGAPPELDELDCLRSTYLGLHRAWALDLRLARIVTGQAGRSGYADRDGLRDLTVALDRADEALAAAGERLTAQRPTAALSLLVHSNLPVPERGVPGERVRVALLDQVPWLQYITALHSSRTATWAADAIREYDARRESLASRIDSLIAHERLELGLGNVGA